MPYKYYKVGNKRWRIWLANLSGVSDGIDKVIKNFTERWVKDDLLILSGISRSDRVFVTVLTPRFKLEYVYNTETGLYYLYTKSKEIDYDIHFNWHDLCQAINSNRN